MSSLIRIAVLGSTGSIGRQALDVAAKHSDRIQVKALAAASSADLLLSQARTFRVDRLALADTRAADRANKALLKTDDPFEVVEAGPEAVAEIGTGEDVDLVVNALVGAAGLRATVFALSAGKKLALANKESLVIGGELVTRSARPGQVVPVDSEHSAIFQCLLGEQMEDVVRIWLTASGGPFRGRTREELAYVTSAEALAHPTWTMGPKITIDSATLMNKGLEVIEAHHLFGLDYRDIRVVIHPQSCIHSMVEFADGSVKAHLGATDMRIPIQYAISHPRRWDSPVQPVDFTAIGSLQFEPPDLEVFRCLALALEAGKQGGTMPAALNAANEVATTAFLEERCSLTDIDRIVEHVMSAHDPKPLESIEQIESVDAWAREAAASAI